MFLIFCLVSTFSFIIKGEDINTKYVKLLLCSIWNIFRDGCNVDMNLYCYFESSTKQQRHPVKNFSFMYWFVHTNLRWTKSSEA